MSYKLKRIMSLMIAVFVAFGLLAAGTGEASAASAKVKVEINNQIDKTNHIYAGEKAYVSAYATKGTKVPTVKSVKVSNKSVAKVKINTIKAGGKKYKEFFVVGKKPGKTKVTVKYKYKGKVKKKTITATVEEYPNPLASLMVSGKSIKLSGDTGFAYDAKYKKTKVNIKAAAAEGWEITEVFGHTDNGKYGTKKYKFADIKKAKSKVKKGSTISFPKKYKYLYMDINLENDEGDTVFYEIILHR